MSDSGSYPPPTVVCPGCGTMVRLQPEPLYPDTPPAICTACGSEAPDYRRDPDTAAAPLPLEERKLSRGGLFRSLGGLLAERAEDVLDDARERLGDTAS